MSETPALSFTDHLRELRSRLVQIVIGLCVGFVICWWFKEILLDIVRQPIAHYLTDTEGQLIFTNPLEKFLSYIKIVFFASLLISCPYWMFQIWKFISPGLYKQEKYWSMLFVACGSVFFVCGILFAYFLVFPLAFRFLLSFGGSGELAYISLKEYIAFFIRTAFVFGVVFETPLVLSFAIKLKLVSVEQLKAARPYVIVCIALVSAFVTPPDVLSMFFLMIPLYLFFEASLWMGSQFFVDKPSAYSKKDRP